MKKPEAKKTSTAVATKSTGGALAFASDLDASLQAQAAAQAGAGTSQRAEDNLVPFIYVLQSNSPQAIKKNQKYIDGAEPGMLMRTDTREVMESMIFQPCFFTKKVNEWIPREDGGGFVGTHDKMPEDAIDHPEKERMKRTADGEHDLVDTRYHFGNILYPDGRIAPACITMKGTQHSVSRAWMVQMNNRQTQAGAIAPSWFTAYEIKTSGRSNSQGDWFVMEMVPLGWINDEKLLKAGKTLHDSVAAGEKVVDHAAEGGEVDEGAGDGDPDAI